MNLRLVALPLEAVVILVEDLLGGGEILGDARLLLPRQADQGVDEVAHHGGLGRHRRHHLELLELGLRLGQRLLAHAGGQDLLLHLLEVGAFLALAELLLDGFDLLVEVVLALALLHLALDAAADALLDLEDVELGLELRQQLLQPAADIDDLEDLLLQFELHRQVGGDGVGQAAGLLDARQRGEDLGRDLLVELHVLVELRQDGAAHRLDLVVGTVIDRDGLDLRDEQRTLVLDVHDPRALRALDQHLDGAVGQLEHLQDVGDAADRIEVVSFGLVLGGRLLRHQQDALAGFHGDLERLDRLRAAHEQRDHHVGEDHYVAQRQQRQGRFVLGDGVKFA